MNIKKATSAFSIEALGMMMYIIYTAMAFFIGVILARNLGPVLFGKYTYLLACIALATSFVTSGWPTLLSREIAAYKYNNRFELIEGIIAASVFFVTFVAGLLIVVLTLVELFEIMHEWRTLVIFSSLSAILFLSWSAVCESSTRGLGYVLVGQVSNRLVQPGVQFLLLSILALGFFSWKITIQTAVYIFTLAVFFRFLFSVYFLLNKRRLGNFRLGRKYDFVGWYSGFWRMSIVGWVGVLTLQIGVLLLGILGEESDISKYKVAVQIASLIPFGLTVINSIQMPALSKAFNSGDKLELQRLASRSCIVGTVMALPIVLPALFAGEELIVMLLGAEYHDAGIILLILTLGQLVNIAAGSTGLLMLVSRNEHTLMITQGIVLFLHILLCIILIPDMGGVGAAIATATSVSIKNIYLIYSIYAEMGIISLPRFW